MRKNQQMWSRAAAAAAALIAGLTATPALATPIIAPPPVVDGQQDGLFITNGATIVLYVQLTEGNEAFFGETTMTVPKGFKTATLYLTEDFATACTPDPAAASLGDCSDGLTLWVDPVTNNIDAAYVSDDATQAELQQFFAGVSSNVSFLGENGDWQDISSLYGQAAGFASVQSDVDVTGGGGGTPFPEPVSISIVGAGLLGLWAVLRRRAHLLED